MAKMEISYSRQLDYQYMIIDAGEDVETDYRLSMLVHNRISGFLPVHVQQMNGKSTLNYEITSLEALPTFLAARKITYDEMVSVLLQFCSAVQEVGRYLLDGEGILLEPEYIYVSKSLEQVRFCYYPYQHTPLYQSVNALCRFLIDHIDYDDRKSLELAYGLFQESLKENLSIRAIVGCITTKLDEKTQDEDGTDELEKTVYKDESDTVDQIKLVSKKVDLAEKSEVTQASLNQKREKTQGIVTVLCTILIIGILGYVLFTAGKRLLQLEMVSENLLIVAAILIVLAAVLSGVLAYWILKPKH